MGEMCDYCTPITLLLHLLSDSPLFEVLQNLAIPTCVAVPTAFLTLAVMSFLCIFRTALATACAKKIGLQQQNNHNTVSGMGGGSKRQHTMGEGGTRVPATEGGGAARTLLQPAYPGPAPGQANTVTWPNPEPAKHVLPSQSVFVRE